MKKGYEIDFTTNTLYMNFKFAVASTEYGTPEYKLLQNIRKDLPNIKIETLSACLREFFKESNIVLLRLSIIEAIIISSKKLYQKRFHCNCK